MFACVHTYTYVEISSKLSWPLQGIVYGLCHVYPCAVWGNLPQPQIVCRQERAESGEKAQRPLGPVDPTTKVWEIATNYPKKNNSALIYIFFVKKLSWRIWPGKPQIKGWCLRKLFSVSVLRQTKIDVNILGRVNQPTPAKEIFSACHTVPVNAIWIFWSQLLSILIVARRHFDVSICIEMCKYTGAWYFLGLFITLWYSNMAIEHGHNVAWTIVKGPSLPLCFCFGWGGPALQL